MDDYNALLRRWIWRDFVNIILGVWLIATAFALGYAGTAHYWSDLASGAVIVALSTLTLWPRFDLARWGICLTGIWLLIAPLVLHTPSAGAYAQDTLVGALVIAFSVLIPMMPGRAHHRVMQTPGPEIPPGWSYTPSGWFQRGPIIAMALVGFFISRYLAAYQMGHIEHVWDPFFGGGTRRVLESDVSKAFPVSDAGLGAVSYMLEALSGFMGGPARWRTMPWMVALFGVLVVPLGVVSIVLVVLQPIAVGAWCALCLVTAVAMLIMIAPAADEIVAMGQFLAGARQEGLPLWRTFWAGGTLASYGAERPSGTPDERDEGKPVMRRIVGALDLDNVPWNLIVTAALGVWLMAAPAVFGTSGLAADADHLGGALIVTWSVIAFGEIVRPARLLNLPIGIGLIALAFAVDGHTAISRWNEMAVGALVIGLSLRRGRIGQRFGSWNRYLI